MKSRDLSQLTDVTEAQYRRSLARMKSIFSKEMQLRRSLSELDSSSNSSMTNEPNRVQAFKSTGSDLLWHRWIARNREQLQTELAMVLAQKSYLAETLRAEFGRAEAARTLLQNERLRAVRAQAAKELTSLEDLMRVMHSHSD